ncbi:MAG: hypothetical protein H0X64_12615 [Gemmatimonadaceae bacterium]|nr:hypothetical protein [Gemmatimonadaceae bacterium]
MIDVNSAGSWAEAHVPGAVNLDPSGYAAWLSGKLPTEGG